MRGALDLAFRFDSGRPFLNLVATVGKRFTTRIERLREARDLARWFVAAGLWEREGHVRAADLAAARELREALFDCVLADTHGGDFPIQALMVVNAWAARSPRAPLLLRSGALAWSASTPREVLAELARDAALTLGGGVGGRVRRCEGADCSIFFLDDSHAGRRRWCSMASCGNRAKVTRFRGREEVR